jgi:hypothetical protein
MPARFLPFLTACLLAAGCDGNSPLNPQPREVLAIADPTQPLVHVWDTAGDSLFRSIPYPIPFPTARNLNVLQFVTAPDSGSVAISFYDGLTFAGQVLRIDLASGAVTTLADFPAGFAVGGGDVVAIRAFELTATGELTATREVYALTEQGLEPRGEAPIRAANGLGWDSEVLDAGRSVLYAVTPEDRLLAYDYAAGEVLFEGERAGAEIMAVVPAGASGGAARVHFPLLVMDGESGERVGQAETLFGAPDLEYSASLGLVVATEANAPFYDFDPEGLVTLHAPGSGARVGEIDATAALGGAPFLGELALSRDGRTAYVSQSRGSGFFEIDLARRAVIAVHPTPFLDDYTTVALIRP